MIDYLGRIYLTSVSRAAAMLRSCGSQTYASQMKFIEIVPCVSNYSRNRFFEPRLN